MNKLLVFLLWLMLIIFPMYGMGQGDVKYLAGNYSFTNYGVKQGLVESTVVEIFQDSKGYLWIGTHGGVSRFDGNNFTNYTDKDGLAGNGVYGITEDTLGNMWFGTFSGLSRFDGEKFFNYGKENGLASFQIWDIILTRKKEVILATNGGLYKVKIKNIENNEIGFENIFFKEFDIRDNIIRDIVEDKNGVLWLGSETCGIKYHPSSGKAEKFYFYGQVNGLCVDKDNDVWIGHWGHEISYYRNNIMKTMLNTGSFPVAFLCDSRGNTWVGTWDKGLFKYDGKEWTLFTVKNGLPINSVWSLFEDKEGNIWVGTFGGGLSRLTNEKIVHFTDANGLVNNIVADIMQDTAKNFWFATEDGISNFNPTRVSPTDNGFINYSNYTNGVRASKITSIYMNFSGTIFFTAYSGGLGGKFENGLMKNIENDGWCSLFDKDGVLWKGCEYEGGLFSSQNNKDSLYSGVKKTRKDINRTFTIYQDSKKNIWLGSLGGGFNIYNGDTMINYSTEEGFSAKAGTAAIEDESGNMWTGTAGEGIFKCSFNNYKIKMLDSLKISNGLSSENIAFLHFDLNKDLWIGTDRGINIFYLNEYLQTGKKVIKSFGISEGVKFVECRGDAYLDHKGMLWFGTSEGAIRINPYDTISKYIAPDIHITDVKIALEKVNWKTITANIDKRTGLPVNPELSYQNNHLTFEFTGISLAMPERIRYSYILEGAETKWSPPATDSKVTFANLPHGKYTFKIKAVNHNEIWSNSPASFQFVILPPWWKTKTFYTSCIIIIILLIYSFIKWRERKLKKEKKILEEIIKERTGELRTANHDLEHKNKLIEEKNKNITDSIRYAERIQAAMLPTDEQIKQLLPDSFVLFKPKDIVSGDFYWITEKNGKIFLCVADSTGHGVPGAFMSMIITTMLNDAVNEKNITAPSDVFSEVRKNIVHSLKQNEESQKDGMDAVLISLNLKAEDLKFKVEYACANNPLFIVRNDELSEMKPDKQPVGYLYGGDERPFTNQQFDLEKGDMLYLISDGYQDQFGGPKGKKFKVQQLRQLLVSVYNKDMTEQKEILNKIIDDWKTDREQVDDICVIGVRI